MIVGIGIDVCDISRMRRNLQKFGPRFMDRLLTPAERAYCERRKDAAVPFAGRFAAKEAAIKALGGVEGLRWHDMEIVPADRGRPRLTLRGAGARAAERLAATRLHLSITHDAGVAAAVVIMESTEQGESK
jgi:holo-[acyl-carrier protein] synthase